MTNEAKRNEDTVEPLVRPLARCDEKGHILVRLGNFDCGMTELQLIDDLQAYKAKAKRQRDKDAVFVALCEIARQWIYDMPNNKISS